MRRSRVRAALILAIVALVVGAIVPNASPTSKPTTATADPLAVLRSTANDIAMGDPDLPPVGHHIDRKAYLSLRANQTSLYRGAPFTLDYNARQVAVQKFEQAMANRGKAGPAWAPIGPMPIPNGQTSPTAAVNGRVTAIAVDPTDANVVYVGTANGGVWRSKNGGTNWTPLFDDEATLAIGSLAVAPSDTSILYVGTGEGNLSGDSYAGLGLYRINSANGTTPVVNGPFEARIAGTGTLAGNGHAFNFLSIQGIAVDPVNADRVYLSATPGGIGMAGDWLCCISPSADPGLYRTTNGTAATPQFSKVAGGLPQSSGSFFPASTDVSFAAGSSSVLLLGIEDIGFQTSANNGTWRSTDANVATPSFSHISLPNTVFNTRIAVGPSSTVLVGAESNVGGRVYKSTDNGATFPTTLTTANGFCSGQCFYDMAPAIDPGNASKMLLGGSADTGGGNILMRATDGASFSSSDAKLHADSHATEYAPSNSSIVYAGNDGGIWKSTDGGATWSSLNNSQFSATQFESVAVHPTDANFSIGGTQDNGTMWYQPAATWNRADFGDGGFAAIDQNAANNTNVTMYHTYFNQVNNLVGYAFVTSTATASDGNWGFRGCGNGVTPANGISCSEDPLFYAPLELGGGTPNSVYYGSDRLHRSTDGGANNPVVSQDFGTRLGGGAISAIGVSPTNDNVRLVGLNGGGIFGTTTGANPLVDLDPGNTIPNKYVGRIVVDPNNADVAYVTINGFNGGTGSLQSHVWKTTDINGGTTVWTAKNSGLPDVPVNAMVVDPNDSNDLYIGTDIGVYASTNGGTSWAPFGTGLPVVPIFDMAIARPGTGSEVLRVATHGRGMYEANLGAGPPPDHTNPTGSLTQPSKSVTINNTKTITVAWNANDTGGSGLDDVDLRVKSAKYNANFGAFTQPAALQHLNGTSKVFAGAAGTSYCFSVRARDHAGNLSAFSAQKCSMIPVDDKTATGTGWSRKTGQAGAYLGTLSVSSTRNKTLTLNNLHARQVGVMVKKCSNCGTFTITFNGQTFSANTAGSGFTVFTIPVTSTVKISNLVIKVFSSGKPVQIDGIVAPQTGSITIGTAVPMHRVR